MTSDDTRKKEIIQRHAGRLLALAKGLEDPFLSQLLAMIVKAADEDAMRRLKRLSEHRSVEEQSETY